MNVNISAARDDELIATLVEADSETVYAELFRRYRQKVYLWCFNYTHDRDDAVELTQEIFIKAFKNISRFAGRSSFSTWMYRITRNHCLSEISKKKHVWRQRLEPVDEKEIVDTTFTDRLEVAARVEDLERILSLASGKMKQDELSAFVLHYRDGLTVKEITRVLGCENVTGARTLIQNARRKFRSWTKGKGFSSD